MPLILPAFYLSEIQGGTPVPRYTGAVLMD